MFQEPLDYSRAPPSARAPPGLVKRTVGKTPKCLPLGHTDGE